MTVQEFVNNVLCVPVSRIGNRYIVEALELVNDTRDHRFYSKLADIHKATPEYFEKAMREAKNLGLLAMGSSVKAEIFGAEERSITTTEYVVRSAEYYRRSYADKI